MKSDYSQKTEELLKELTFLFEKYSVEQRASTQPHILERIQNRFPEYRYDPKDELIRETLIEHVGSIPIFTAAFYPYIDNDEVDLGKALTMLAIHDIGELISGDEMTFTKKDNAKDVEYQNGMSLLNPYYHSFYDDIENQKSVTAKFAKAVDKITPDIIDYLAPADVTLKKYKYFLDFDSGDQIIDIIVKKKRPYMLWNPFMTEFHKLLLERFKEKIS